jgi:hypothetical protein
MPTGPRAADWRLEELTSSPIAKRIDEVGQWLDSNVQSSATVRLLIVPAFYLHAFWLFEPTGSEIVIIDRPDAYSALEYRRTYSADEFLAALRQLPHASGLPRRP